MQVPMTTAGPHHLTINDGGYTYSINLTRLPKVTDDYTDLWRTENFTVNLTPDYGGNEIFYKINYGPVCSISNNGQPLITTEGSSNILEYWGTWNVYGTGNLELSHMILTNIKLDATTPHVSLQINGDSMSTTSNTVTLTLTATDSTSGINRIRFSNDDTWNQATWEPYASSKSWQLTNGDGAKTVYCEIQDNAGLNTTVSASITLNTLQFLPTLTLPTATSSSSPFPTTTPTSTIYPYDFIGPLPSGATRAPAPTIDGTPTTSPTPSPIPTQTPTPNPSPMSLNVPVIGAIILIGLILIGLLVKRKSRPNPAVLS
jgi:hypothetical protein